MLVALLISLASAATPAPLSLDDLLDQVARGAPQLRTQEESVAVARAGQRLAGAWEDPTVGLMIEDVPVYMKKGDMGAPMAPMVTYSVTQPLNLFGRRRLAKEAAEARIGVEQATLRRVEWDACAQATMGFYDLWMNEEMGKLLDRQIALLDRMRSSAKARYSAGLMMGHHDILRAESELARMTAEKASLADERAASMAMLNVLRNHPRDEELGSPALPTREPLPDLASLLADAPGRPELEGMAHMRDQMASQVDLAKRMYLPMVMVQGFFQQRLGTEPNAVGGAVMFTVPIFWWDRQAHDVEMSEAMYRRTERDRETMQAMTDADLRSAWSHARAADRSLDALESTVLPRMKDTVDSALAAYASGTGDFLGLLESAMAQREVEMELIQVRMKRENARFELARLLGKPLTASRSP
jgi:cobalt-zinc-cadmium efflux system outer membrane protein